MRLATYSVMILLWAWADATVIPDCASAEETSEIPESSEATMPKSDSDLGAELTVILPDVSEEFPASGPDVFILPDKSGKLRKVLGFRYEDFLRSWQDQHVEQKTAPPEFTIQSIDIQGRATAVDARLTLEISLVTQTAGWVNIPLQLPTLILRQIHIDHQQQGECLVYDSMQHNYVLWLKGQIGKPRKLVLDGIAKLQLESGFPTLELYLPTAPITNTTLHVPGTDLHVKASPGLRWEQSGSQSGGTEIRISGRANPLEISWEAPELKTHSEMEQVEASGEITVTVDRRRVTYEAALSIAGHEVQLDRVSVRLPLGSTLTESTLQQNFQFKVIDAGTTDQGQVVEIRPMERTNLPWVIPISAEQLVEENFDQLEYAIGGFEVLNAYRQSGNVTLQLADQLQAYFDLHGAVRQVSLRERESQNADSSTLACLRYDRFPWSVSLHGVPQRRRVSVRPHYELQVEPAEAVLKMALDYQLVGAQTYSLRIDLRGWKLTDDPIESGGVVDVNRYVETRQGFLVLPLLSRDAKQLRLHLTARRDVSLGTNTFPLPELLGSVVLDGSLSVESNSSIRLTPDSRGTKGLSSIPLDESVTSARDGEIKEGTHQQRYRTFLSQPVMIADVAIRKRQNSVEMNSSISLTETVAQVSQVLQYDVKYHPSSQLLLRIPEELWLNRSLEVHVDGQEAAFGLGINSNDSNYDAIEKTEKIDFSLRQMIVTLPRPLLGSFKLELDYKLPIPELAKGSVASFVLPLIVPEGNLKRNTLIISAESQIQLTLGRLSAEGQWTTLAPGIAGTSSDTLQLSSLTKPSALPLLLHRESSEDRELVMLEQAWLQSWVAGGLQQDRAVFLFRTSDSHAFIQLPPNQPEVAVELILDGLAVETPLFAEGRLAVALDDSAPQTKHTLELRYQRPVALGSWRNLVTELPYLECRPTSSPVYWQLILPRGWQIVSSPEKLSPDYWLGWKDYHWGRQPTHLQEDLQRITNATSAPPPPLSTTQYTFRAFQLPQQVEVVIVRKVWLIAAFTLLAFGIGVLLLKTQLARQGVFWLTVAALLFGTSFLFPEVTLITVQTILWGGLLTLSFVVLRSVFGADAQAVRGSSGSVARHSTTATESWALPQSGLDANDEDAATTLQSGGSSR